MAQLIKEVQTVKQYAEKVEAQNEILRESNATLNADYAKELEVANKGISECYSRIDLLNYEILELNKMHNDLIESHNKVTAENYALKAEIERTNRHINLAENALHNKQQPLVVNHYHNCTINK